MGRTIMILDIEERLLFGIGISSAGSNTQAILIGGKPAEAVVTRSEACFTSNYRLVWNELGWNPWRWLDSMPDPIIIDADTIIMLTNKLESIVQMPDQERSRGFSKSGYYAATPENAADMIEWIITWSLDLRAYQIKCL